MLYLLPSVRQMTLKDLMTEFALLQEKGKKYRARCIALAREIDRRLHA